MKRGHVPNRMCVGCRQVKPKETLLRIVSTTDGSGYLDATHYTPGRGSYLCLSPDCLRSAQKRGTFSSYTNYLELTHIISSGIHGADSADDLKGC